MTQQNLIRPKDIGRLAGALLASLMAAVGLQLVFGCMGGSLVGGVGVWMWLLSQWPFARLRLQLRRTLVRKRRDPYADYFQN